MTLPDQHMDYSGQHKAVMPAQDPLRLTESPYGPKQGTLGLIYDHQVLATHFGKGLSQADKGRSRSTKGHLNPTLGAPSSS